MLFDSWTVTTAPDQENSRLLNELNSQEFMKHQSATQALKIRTAKVFRCFPAFVLNGSVFRSSDRGRYGIGRPRVMDDLKVLAVVGCMVRFRILEMLRMSTFKTWGRLKPLFSAPVDPCQLSHPCKLLGALQTVAHCLCLSTCLGSNCHPSGLGNHVEPSLWAVKSTMWGPPKRLSW
eukprot:s3855_g2.t1